MHDEHLLQRPMDTRLVTAGFEITGEGNSRRVLHRHAVSFGLLAQRVVQWIVKAKRHVGHDGDDTELIPRRRLLFARPGERANGEAQTSGRVGPNPVLPDLELLHLPRRRQRERFDMQPDRRRLLWR